MENPHPPSTLVLARRSALGLIFLTGTGLLLGSKSADAMWSVADVLRSMQGEGPVRTDVPPAIRGLVGGQAQPYTAFLKRLNLRNISIQAIIDSHAKARGKIHNTLPPRHMWGNIRNTLLALDKVASRLRAPVKDVVSVYRSPAYNASCPGARSHSYHMRNNAIDFRFAASPRQVAAVARQLRAEGVFKGGVGRYSGFVHIDTRGTNADW